MTSGVVLSDSLQAAVERVLADPAYQWVERADPWRLLKVGFLALQRELTELFVRYPWAERVLVLSMLVLLGLIVLHAAWILFTTMRTAGAALPMPTEAVGGRSAAWYRDEADRLAAAGRYPEAMQADFLALVVTLDAEAQLRFHPSKTPAEYVSELPWQDGRREAFQGLVQTLYGYAFARWPCSGEQFLQWRDQVTPARYVAVS